LRAEILHIDSSYNAKKVAEKDFRNFIGGLKYGSLSRLGHSRQASVCPLEEFVCKISALYSFKTMGLEIVMRGRHVQR